ncbi:MAG: ABC transporter permease subunit [Chloroflexi bacterium]|nr:ABC transporter permease subunit [Chloroflexota bacterium]
MKAVFNKAFHDSGRFVFWMSVASVLYVLLIMAFYPSMIEQSEEMDKLMESYPKEMMSMFYGGDVEEMSISDPGNYVQSQFITWLELMLGGIVIVQAFNALTNAERDGTLDVMLSLPVSRRAYLLGRILNTVAGVLILLAACWGSLWLSTLIWPEFDVSIGRLALGTFGGFFPTMVVAGFAYLLAAIIPSSKHFSGPLCYLFLFGSYLLYMLAAMINSLKGFKPIFVFHYYNGGQIIREGINVGDWLLLSGVAVIYFALAWWLVEKKELGV